MRNLIDKGQIQILYKSKHKSIETYITLFDNIVKQIILYASEIWGIMANNANIEKIGKSLIERFHLKICKQILGVHRKATNLAVFSELGRYPLYIEIQERMIKYFLRFKVMKDDRLAFKAYREQIENKNNNQNWVSNIEKILGQNGLSYIFINQMNASGFVGDMKDISKQVKKRSQDIFEQSILHYIKYKSENNEGKLIFYGTLKERFKKENYLNIKNVEYRKIMCKMRISAHNLEIEKGRYSNTEKEGRLCKVCKLNEIETEEHFILNCTMYNNHRKSLYEEIKTVYNIDLEKQKMEGIKKIFLQEDLLLINRLGKFLKQCWVTREKKYHKRAEIEKN